jgi:hypothetical protein
MGQPAPINYRCEARSVTSAENQLMHGDVLKKDNTSESIILPLFQGIKSHTPCNLSDTLLLLLLLHIYISSPTQIYRAQLLLTHLKASG